MMSVFTIVTGFGFVYVHGKFGTREL